MAKFADDDTSATIERMSQLHLKNTKDALIAASARDEADVIVTEDKKLRHRIRREGMNVRLMSFEEFRRHVSSLSG
jgi:rRNA-processing protein FCF1